MKPSDSALLFARRLTPRERRMLRDTFKQTPPTDPIWMRGCWPDFTPVELDAALKWPNK